MPRSLLETERRGRRVALLEGRLSDGRTPAPAEVDLYFRHGFHLPGHATVLLEVTVLNLIDQDAANGFDMSRFQDVFGYLVPDDEFLSGWDPEAVAAANQIGLNPAFGMADTFPGAATGARRGQVPFLSDAVLIACGRAATPVPMTFADDLAIRSFERVHVFSDRLDATSRAQSGRTGSSSAARYAVWTSITPVRRASPC